MILALTLELVFQLVPCESADLMVAVCRNSVGFYSLNTGDRECVTAENPAGGI